MVLAYSDVQADVKKLAENIKTNNKTYTGLYGIPRGGVPVAALLAAELELPLVDTPIPGALVVDDLIDSGKTISEFEDYDTAVLYIKGTANPSTYYVTNTPAGQWIEFPWEDTNTDVQENFRRILEYLGEDPNREGLQDTPKRYIKFMQQFLKKEKFNFTVFDAEGYDELIVQKDIPFFSLCEHHIAPFFGTATVAYIPNEKIVGLSKLARTVQHYSHNFQNQERITSQIAERLTTELNPKGVAVMIKARHFCMEMRGVKTHDVHTVTTKLTGVFLDEPETRAEFMSHAGCK